MSDLVYLEKDGNIAVVTLNKPERLNAMDETMWRGLGDIMKECDADTDLRCIIIRGAGGRAFGAGADIKEFETTRKDKKSALTYGDLTTLGLVRSSSVATRSSRKSTVYVWAAEWGLHPAATSGYVAFQANSRVPVKKLGLVEAHEEMRPLVEKFGANVALEILLVGDVFPVADALRMGLVNQVVPDDQVAATARQFAERIADGAPLSARWHKKFIYRLLDPTPLTEAEIDEGFDCYDTEDFQVGRRAFVEKSAPEFFGR